MNALNLKKKSMPTDESNNGTKTSLVTKPAV